ncbi:MAG: polysaccharide pyruvyl transferase family protein [Microbacterium sp.]
MKIGVTNAVLSNTGDAAIYESIVDSLSRVVGSECRVVVFDSNAAVTQRLYPDWEIYQQVSVSPPREPARLRSGLQRIRHALVRRLSAGRLLTRALGAPLLRRTRFARAFRALESVDLLVSSGGTYLVDHYNFEARVLELRLAAALGKPVVLWTQSMGPFDSERARAQISRIAPTVDAVFFRDARSERAWNGAVPQRPPGAVVADSVFALEIPSRGGSSGRRAALSVREWSRGVDSGEYSMEQYESAMRAAARRLEELGWSTTALSTCQGVPSYAYDDSEEAARIFASTAVEIDHDFHSPRALLEELRGYDLVVTTRMHLAILAMISRVPVIAIAYEFKTLELFESLGLGHLVRRIEEVTPEWIADAVTRVVDAPQMALLSDGTIASLRESARRPAKDVRALVTG